MATTYFSYAQGTKQTGAYIHFTYCFIYCLINDTYVYYYDALNNINDSSSDVVRI